MQRTPTDLFGILVEMRNGMVASDINAKFQEVLDAVLDTAGKGELTIKLTFAPSRLAMGGVVCEVEASHECKLKRPEQKIGKSAFFVNADGRLTRDNPDQEQMFGAPQVKKEPRRNG